MAEFLNTQVGDELLDSRCVRQGSSGNQQKDMPAAGSLRSCKAYPPKDTNQRKENEVVEQEGERSEGTEWEANKRNEKGKEKQAAPTMTG